LFVTEIFHEIEEEEFWDDIKAAGGVDDQLDKFLETVEK
jgi:hypothetical protein